MIRCRNCKAPAHEFGKKDYYVTGCDCIPLELEELRVKASDFLSAAAKTMEQRGKQYDQPGGERSMGKVIAAFNAITGRNLTEMEGWLIMDILKSVRQWQNPSEPHVDSLLDKVAYAALMAESYMCSTRSGTTDSGMGE